MDESSARTPGWGQNAPRGSHSTHRLDTTYRVPRNLVDAAERQRMEMPRSRPMRNQVSSTRECHLMGLSTVLVGCHQSLEEALLIKGKTQHHGVSVPGQRSHHGRGKIKAKTFAESRTLSKSTEATKRQVTKPSATNYVR